MSLFISRLKECGYLDNIHVTICNVGSRKLSQADDYASKAWKYFAPNLTIYGFDADADACEAAHADLEERQITWTEKHIPLAISGEIGEQILYVTKHHMCSSLYKPNEEFLARFEQLPELVNLDFELEIETTTLDEFCKTEGLTDIDFLQIDVQGADLDVLKGATEILPSVMAIQIEVEFSELYQNQPLFHDIDLFLRRQGFILFDLSTTRCKRSKYPRISRMHPGQLLWGEAYYLRDPLQLHDSPPNQSIRETPEKLLKLACIADAMQFSDYSSELFEYLTLHYGKDSDYNVADILISSLREVSELTSEEFLRLEIIKNLQHLASKSVIQSLPPLGQKAVNVSAPTPITSFHRESYLRHNQRRLEHLSSLNLDLTGKTVLELGAGIGDHTTFFLDRDCQVTTTEGRPENLEILKQRYPGLPVFHLDMDQPNIDFQEKFDLVYCYGLLYHLKNPLAALDFIAENCQGTLLLESCVSYGSEDALNPVAEPAHAPSQALSGSGCRPTRFWIYERLKERFEFVYFPLTQPCHAEFPTDWNLPNQTTGLVRAVFIASRQSIDNPLLTKDMPMAQSKG